MHPERNQATGALRNFIAGGDHVYDCALPGFDARYLAQTPGFKFPGTITKAPCQNRPVRRPFSPRLRNPCHDLQFRAGPLPGGRTFRSAGTPASAISSARPGKGACLGHAALAHHDLAASFPAPLDRASWLSLWRPYWLAKRRIPEWLAIAPSRDALDRL